MGPKNPAEKPMPPTINIQWKIEGERDAVDDGVIILRFGAFSAVALLDYRRLPVRRCDLISIWFLEIECRIRNGPYFRRQIRPVRDHRTAGCGRDGRGVPGTRHAS